MTENEIAERLVQAAELMAHSGPVGPKPPRSIDYGYLPSYADRLGWGRQPGDRACQLRRDDWDAHAAARAKFWESLSTRPTARQVSEAEEALSWYALVDDEDHRAALSAWVWCSASNGRHFFQDWCRQNGFSREAGRRRKDHALSAIRAELLRKRSQNSDGQRSAPLRAMPDDVHNSDTVERGAGEERSPRAWMADDAFGPVIPGAPVDFSWAEKRNEIRRQREARRRKLAEKLAKSG